MSKLSSFQHVTYIKNYSWNVLHSFFPTVFKILYGFHTFSPSQFSLVPFCVLGGHIWLRYWTAKPYGICLKYFISKALPSPAWGQEALLQSGLLNWSPCNSPGKRKKGFQAASNPEKSAALIGSPRSPLTPPSLQHFQPTSRQASEGALWRRAEFNMCSCRLSFYQEK
jgi:hypothetical protein